MNKRILAMLIAVLMIVVPGLGMIKEVKAADGYTVPVTYSEEGYKLTGLEDPFDGEVDNRTIDITVENPDEYTIYDFELTVTNADKQIRKVYSSKLYLDEEVDVITSGYNLVIFKGDQVKVKYKKTPINKSSLKDSIEIKDGCSVKTMDVLVNDGGFDQPATYYNERRTIYLENCKIKETINNSFDIYPTPIEVVGYGTNIIKQPVMVSKFKHYKREEIVDIKSESIFQPLEGNSGYTPKQFKSEFYIGKVKYLGTSSPFSTIVDSNTKKVKVKSIVPKTITYSLSKNSTSEVIKSGKLEPTEEIIFEKLDGQKFRVNITGADDLNPGVPDTPGSDTCDTTELDNKIKQLEAQITQLKKDLATKTTANDTLTKENEQLKKDKAELEEKLKKAEDALAAIKTKVEEIIGEGEAGQDMTADLEKLNQQLKDLKAEVEGYKAEIEKLKAENQKLQDRIKELEENKGRTPIPEGPYTVPVTNAEGYEIKGLETPLEGEAEAREIEIVATADKETTVDNFEIVITNPNRPPRTVYSSIVWLGENKVEGKSDKQILNSTKYNIVMYKNDKVELKVKSEPYTLENTKDEKTDTTNPSNPDKTTYVPGEEIYDKDCFKEACRAYYKEKYENCRREYGQAKECGDYMFDYNTCHTYAEYRKNYDQYPQCIRESSGTTKRESQGTYTQTITTTTEKYTSPELDVRHKPIEISGTNLTLKNNAKTKIDYTFSWKSKEVITGKKNSNGNSVPDVNNTNINRPTPNFALNMPNAGYSVTSTAAEDKEFEVVRMPEGTTAETITLKPGTSKDLSAYKDSTIAFVSKSEKEAGNKDVEIAELTAKVADLEKKLAECEGKCSSADELAECNKDKAALQAELDDLKKKVDSVVDDIGAEAGQDIDETLENLKNKVKELQDKLDNLNPEVKKVQDRIDEIDAQKAKAEEALKDDTKSPEEKAALEEEIKNLADQKAKLEEALRAILDGKYEEAQKALDEAKALNKELQEKLDNLNAKLKEAQAKLDELNNQLKDKEAALKDLNQKIADNDQAIKDLEKQIEDAKAEDPQDEDKIKDLEKQLEDKKSEGEKLANDKKALEDEIEALKAKIKALEDAIAAAANGDYDKIKEALEKAQKDLADANDRIAELEAQAKDLNDLIEALRAQIKELNDKIEEGNDALNKAKADLEDLKGQLEDAKAKATEEQKALQDKLDEANNKVKDLNDKIKANEEAEADLKKQLEDEKAKADADQDKIKELEDKIAEKETEKADLNDRKAEAEKQAEDLEKELGEKNAEIENLNKEIEAKEAEIANKQAEIDNLKKEKEDLEDKIKSLIDTDIKALQEELAKAKKELGDKDGRIAELEARIAELEAELANQNEKVKEIQAELDKNQDEIAKKEAELKDLEDKLAKNKEEQDAIRKQLEDEKNKPEAEQDKDLIDKLEKDLADKEAEGKNLEEQIQALKDAIEALKAQKKALEDAIAAIMNGDYEKAKEDLRKANEALAEANKRIAELEAKNKELQDRIDSLNDKVNEVQARIDEIDKQVAEKQAEIDALNKKIEENEAAKKEIEDKLAEEKNKPEDEQDKDLIAKLEKELAEKETESAELANEKAKLENEIESLKAQKKALEDAIAALLNGDADKAAEALAKAEAEKKAAEERNAELERELEEAKKAIEENKKAIEENKKAIEEKDKTIEENEKALEDKKAAEEKLQKELEEKTKTEEAKDKKINDLEKDLKDAKNNTGGYVYVYEGGDYSQADIDKRDKEIKELKAENEKLSKKADSTDGPTILGPVTSDRDSMTIFTLTSPVYKTYYQGQLLTQAEMTDFNGRITPMVSNQRTMLPIRYVALTLGMDVEWNQATQKAIFTNRAGQNVLNVGTVTIDARTLEMRDQNGNVIAVDSQPILKNGRFFVSITNIIRAFGGTNGNLNDGVDNTIEWDQATQRVLVYKNAR